MNNVLAAKVLMSRLLNINDGAYRIATEIAIETLLKDAINYWYAADTGITLKECLDLSDDDYKYWVGNRSARSVDFKEGVLKMAKCKYPDETCAHATVLHGVSYCDAVPCIMKDETPKQTNADWLRSLNNEELANLLADPDKFSACQQCEYLLKDAMCESCNAPSDFLCVKEYAAALIQSWLESEHVEESECDTK